MEVLRGGVVCVGVVFGGVEVCCGGVMWGCGLWWCRGVLWRRCISAVLCRCGV